MLSSLENGTRDLLKVQIGRYDQAVGGLELLKFPGGLCRPCISDIVHSLIRG